MQQFHDKYYIEKKIKIKKQSREEEIDDDKIKKKSFNYFLFGKQLIGKGYMSDFIKVSYSSV